MTITTVPSAGTADFAGEVASIRFLAEQAEELRRQRDEVLDSLRARSLDIGDYVCIYGHHNCPNSHKHGPNAEVGDRVRVYDSYSAAKTLPGGGSLRAVR